ncbi:MAG: ATP synthase F1 subunit delta, partial [Candidatus Gastranaerophilaceae bacterium]
MQQQIDSLEKYKVITERYVNALTQIADENNSWDVINDDLTKLVQLLKDNVELENFLLHPVIEHNDKKDVIEKVVKGFVTEQIFDFLNILLDKNRVYLIPSIQESFKEHLLKKNNIINIYVKTAIELDDDMKNRLLEKLGNKLQKKVNIISDIDKSIIGGVILQ